MDENFLLEDRLTKIRSINDKHNLLEKSYVSFSGGKDSAVLSALVDLALPGNKIPRVFVNTGIEYFLLVKFVKESAVKDDRIVIISPKVSIKETLEKYGYPFKSKEHSEKISVYQHSGMVKTVRDYLGLGEKKNFLCPEKFKYNFTPDFKLKCSKKCCEKMKKNPLNNWAKENSKPISLVGLRKNEGGSRASLTGCTVFYDKDCNVLKKFFPLFPVEEDWLNWFVKEHDVRLSELYYPPYNFKRTGCKGCPFNMKLQQDLDTISMWFPSERKQCEMIWKPVYDEYRRIGKLRKTKSLFDNF